ncbi:hypothetical protein GUITHDRAFT_149535 [Guillardia theta CCMP2712]|uniref:SAM domain-containing protein n=1 Tax=Guillardia theta (strain CCMP2712) TaxID=905079 RepID=L1I4L5_GUITC|nr:hypothetical protein GUITHDRAFT_149535 [Guillardia theta CCMP2712]EKX31032.1 hypothetical protein GUITHDRAFT_149535 [Guillardia theta CCMP2712]|eukprot:XP_005818012.1 hypothetical protein GUITHDRAFT_149535 [Guillardia theta CCMP2712]
MKSLGEEEDVQAVLKRAGLDLHTLLQVDNDILLNAALREAGVTLVGDRMRVISRIKQLRQSRREGAGEEGERSLTWTDSRNIDSRHPTPKTQRRSSSSSNKIHPSSFLYSSALVESSLPPASDFLPSATPLDKDETSSASSSYKPQAPSLPRPELEDEQKSPAPRRNSIGSQGSRVSLRKGRRSIREEGKNEAEGSKETRGKLLVSRSSQPWRRNRDEVDKRMKRTRLLAAIVGCCGSIAACLQNELVIRGMNPQENVINGLKGLNSLLSLLLFLLTLRLYSLDILFERIRLHLRALHVLKEEVELGELLGSWRLWGEVGLFCLHVPPFLSLEVPLYNWNNFLSYRLETLGAALNLLRLLLFWKCFRDSAISSLPRRHTVSSFTGVRMDSAFVLKRILNSPQAFSFIAALWLLLIVIAGYWFRCLELSACFFGTSQHPLCESEEAKVWVMSFHGEHNTTTNAEAFEKVNDLYIQNAMWAMFTTSTTVGYGDVTPTTYGGRVVGAITNVAGLLLVAALTSSLSHVLMYTDEETSAMCLFDREKAAARLLHLAALLIQSWWAKRKARREGKGRRTRRGWWSWWGSGEETGMGRYGRWMEFERAKEKSVRELNACLGPNMKVDLLYARMKRLTASSLSLRLKLSPSSSSFRRQPPDLEAEEELLNTVKAIKRRKSIVLLPRQRRTSSAYQSYREDRIDNFYEAVEALRSRYYLSKRLQWRRDRGLVERVLVRSRFLAALCGISGTCMAVAQSELVFAGVAPEAFAVQLLKGANSLLTILCMVRTRRS